MCTVALLDECDVVARAQERKHIFRQNYIYMDRFDNITGKLGFLLEIILTSENLHGEKLKKIKETH